MSGSIRDPATTTVQLAEQALLGALLWDPSRVREVMGWLTPDDFYRPAHGDIYAVLVTLTRAGAAADPLTVTTVLADGRYSDGPAHHHAAAYLHTLLSFTPATPNPARDRGPIKFYTGPNISHHVAYARLVLEASVRRQLRGAGVRIGQHARDAVQRAAADEPADATVAASADRLEPVLDLIERQLELLAARLPSAPVRPAQHPATPSATAAGGASGFATAVRADRLAQPTVRTMSSQEWAAASQNRARGEGTERSVLRSHGWGRFGSGPSPTTGWGCSPPPAPTLTGPRRSRRRSAAPPTTPRCGLQMNCSPAARRRLTGCSAPPPPPTSSSAPNTG